MCYLAIQAMAGFAIIFLTTTSSQLSSQISEQVSWLGSLSNSIVPAAVSIINAMLPSIIFVITKFEKVGLRRARPYCCPLPRVDTVPPLPRSGTTGARTSSSSSPVSSSPSC